MCDHDLAMRSHRSQSSVHGAPTKASSVKQHLPACKALCFSFPFSFNAD